METRGLQNDLLAEETHAARVWCLAILPALMVPVITVVFYPTRPAVISMVFLGLIGGGALALMWSGFQYRFLRHGVEVRTLGYTLLSIPKQQIVSYAIESWSLLRGYGIRGIGNTRAYVWCNKVVHISTTNGEIVLGHDDPERIIRDLDRVMGQVTTSACLEGVSGSH
jgi:hypothetical protein